MTEALMQLETGTRRPPRRLSALADDAAVLHGDAEIQGLCDDSRRIRPGDAFLCLPRAGEHALEFATQAAEAGAAAVISVAGCLNGEAPLPHLALPDMEAAGRLLRRWFGTERTAVRLIGVTGTDGKTSVAWMLREALARKLGAAWTVGTLGWVRAADDRADLGNTTPSLLVLHRLLALATEAGVPAIACEVSSHGIEQRRIAGLPFAAAVWTNLGHDHLQDHGGFDAYAAIKRRFVSDVAAAGGAVIANLDDAEVRIRLPEGAVGFGRGLYRDDVALGWEQELPGMVRLRRMDRGGGSEVRIEDAPMGEFHAANLAAVALTLLAADLAGMDDMPALLSGIGAPPGRMQALNIGRWQVFVDYAHTPEALASCLKAAREMARGRLLVVFGCGGGRDRGKRAPMGAIAARLADRVWITNDNPRNEPPEAIAEDILSGVPPEARARVRVVLDREQAIAEALAERHPRDLVVIAGKGAERTMEIGSERLPWSDAAIVQKIVRERACASEPI